MKGLTRAATILGVLAGASPVLAQEVIRLRNERYVTGTVVLRPADPEGFDLQLWDSPVPVYFRWSQLGAGEKERLLAQARKAEPPQEKAAAPPAEPAPAPAAPSTEEILAQRVPDLWRTKRSEILSKSAGTDLFSARERVAGMDERIERELADRLKATREEIRQAWAGRAKKVETAGYGSGTWIAFGGQDGGLDLPPPPAPDPVPAAPRTWVGIPMGEYTGWTWTVWVPASDPAPRREPVLGRWLERAPEWWARASAEQRREWLKADYARTSAGVTKTEETPRKCPACAGHGCLREIRRGIPVEPVCPRCHGARQELTIRFW